MSLEKPENKKDYILDIYIKLDNQLHPDEMERAIKLLHLNNEEVTEQLKRDYIEKKELEAWKRRIAYNYARIRNINNNMKRIKRNAKNE